MLERPYIYRENKALKTFFSYMPIHFFHRTFFHPSFVRMHQLTYFIQYTELHKYLHHVPYLVSVYIKLVLTSLVA
jgi:hypothetical protein